jgi:hypothetical protein
MVSTEPVHTSKAGGRKIGEMGMLWYRSLSMFSAASSAR